MQLKTILIKDQDYISRRCIEINITDIDINQLEDYAKAIMETTSTKGMLDDKDKVSKAEQGIAYYNGEMDIDKKAIYGISAESGEYHLLDDIPNNKFKDNQYRKLVDQKVNYVLSSTPNIYMEDENEEYMEILKDFFDNRLMRTLRKVAIDSYNTSAGWLYVYLSDDGESLKYQSVNPLDIVPKWADEEKEKLECVIWKRQETKWDPIEKRIVTYDYVRLCSEVAMYEWEVNGDKWGEMKIIPYLTTLAVNEEGKTDEHYSTWGKIPFIYFRYDRDGYTLLDRVKSMQDGLNSILSNFGDKIMQDIKSSILVVTGYGGEALENVRANLIEKRVVGVNEDGGGSIDTLDVEYTPEEYELMLSILKEKLIENGRGFDVKSDKLGSGVANELNIKSAYADLELDANGLELEYQASFEYLQYFLKIASDLDIEEVATIEFNRSSMVAEQSLIENLNASADKISNITYWENNPLVSNASLEAERWEEERQKYRSNLEGAYLEDYSASEVMEDEG